jgi:hypothetical protein
LERLGTPDFWPNARQILTRAYDEVTKTAVAIAYPDETNGTADTQDE